MWWNQRTLQLPRKMSPLHHYIFTRLWITWQSKGTEVLPTRQTKGAILENDVVIVWSWQLDMLLQWKKHLHQRRVIYPENTRPGQVPGTAPAPSVMRGQRQEAEGKQLCTRANQVNTRQTLITPTEGQEEKNRHIPELLNDFRSGLDWRLFLVQENSWTLTKKAFNKEGN